MSAEPRTEPNRAPHALVIEDSEHTAYLLAFMLERAGYEVTTVDNGRDAERLLSGEATASIVLLDLMLPYVDGYQLLTQIRADPRWRDVPVIVVSAKIKEADVVRAFELGASDYVTKPFRPHELLARMRRLTADYQPRAAAR